MISYRINNEDGTVVENLTTGEKNIQPGSWRWDEYQRWLVSGGIPIASEQIIDKVRIKKMLDLDSEASKYFWGGVKYLGKWYGTDELARAALSSMIGYASRIIWDGGGIDSIMTGCSVVSLDGTYESATPRLVSDISRAIALNDQTITNNAAFHRDMIKISAQPGGYDLTGGWPMTFKEDKK